MYNYICICTSDYTCKCTIYSTYKNNNKYMYRGTCSDGQYRKSTCINIHVIDILLQYRLLINIEKRKVITLSMVLWFCFLN